tara:strand:+ start:1720 stop:3630 length:1911 start_codon:yes stop_codon:yes gene_type:complete
MKNFLVVKKLSLFNILIVMLYKFFKFEVYVFESSGRILNWRLVKLLSLKKCNFEDCLDIDLSRYGGNIGKPIDQITSKWISKYLLETFTPFFANVKNANIKNNLLIREYVLGKCTRLNNICVWIDGYFLNHEKDNLNIYLLGDISIIEKKFLKTSFDDLKIQIIFSSNLFVVFELLLKVFKVFYKKIFLIINNVISSKSRKYDSSFLTFPNSNTDTFLYKVLYFPHKSIFYGDLYLKDNFYSEDLNSAFFPANILHIEFENLSLTESQSQYYKDNKIETEMLPKLQIKEALYHAIYIIKKIGLKKILFFLRKDFLLFLIFLMNTVKFLSTKKIITENYDAKLVLVGFDILFPTILSLAFESLQIKTVALQERFLPTFFLHYPFLMDTYFCNSEFVSKTIQKSNNKFVNHCIPCGQPRSDILVNFQKNITSKNKRFTVVAFDFHSDLDFDDNRLNVLINWRANASFYRDLCNLAKSFPDMDIIIRGKNTDWTKIPFFKDELKNVNKITNIWIDDDYSKLNKQYELASLSDLVIAKYTSIGDEIIAAGKRIIYHDFTPNSSHFFASGYFNYNNHNVFAYSYDQLFQMVYKVVNGDELLTDKELLELQLITNNAPADGNTKDRVMKNLNIIYNQTYSSV